MSARASTPPCLALISGSGMSGVADGFAVESTTPFDAIEGVGACTVAGHRGEVRWCRWGEARFAVVLGRRHLYEGEPRAMRRLFEALHAGGVRAVVVASAAGSLARDVAPGELVIVRDALDFQNRDRRTGAAARRRDAHGAAGRPVRRLTIDPGLSAALERACLAAGVRATRGVLACFAGPTYETPAEVEWSRFTGAALVTMSAAPEIAFANQLGMPVAVLTTITNFATGVGHSMPDHEDVVDIAGSACAGLARIILQLLETYRVEDDPHLGVYPSQREGV
jgi:purine-nucleoside phosphorylase